MSFCQSATIDSFTSGNAVTIANYWGQSFTTPAGGPWEDLTFNFYTSPNDVTITPIAAGTGYLLTQQYTGTPANIGSFAPGFLAASTDISNNEYVFAPSVQLLAGTVYYFYENASINICADPSLPASSSYIASGSASPFTNFGNPADFTLSGNIAAGSVPEPLTAVLALMGLCSIIIFLRSQDCTETEPESVSDPSLASVGQRPDLLIRPGLTNCYND